MKPENPTNESESAQDIERAHETVIESLKSQHPDWVDEKGEWPYCVAYEYELADPAGTIGRFIVGWFVVGTLVATPFLTYYFGKRCYCSWVCGWGGLANTFGDSFRQNSDKSLKAWKIERWMIHSVLVFIVLLTALLWFEPSMPDALKGPVYSLRKLYGFLIGSAFAGVVGVGFYPLMGTRVWCRFGCPMAAMLGEEKSV